MSYVIYIHTCKISGKSYVGITNKTAEERFAEHCQAARRGSKFAFHGAIRKYGEDCWVHEATTTTDSLQKAYEMEMRLIAVAGRVRFRSTKMQLNQ